MTKREAIAISVVIPALNASSTIGELLESLESQEFRSEEGGWELVVVDDGSTDNTVDICQQFDASLPHLRLVSHPRPMGRSLARNAGAAAAFGEKIVFCDADDVVRPGWLQSTADALDHFDVAGPRLSFERLNDPICRAWYGPGPITDAQPSDDELIKHRNLIAVAPGTGFAVRRDVLTALGGWEPRFEAAEDLALSTRAYQAGYSVGLASGAVIDYRTRTNLRALGRNYRHYGRGQARVHVELLRDRATGSSDPGDTAPGSSVIADARRVVVWLVCNAPLAIRDRRCRGVWVRTVNHSAGFATAYARLIVEQAIADRFPGRRRRRRI